MGTTKYPAHFVSVDGTRTACGWDLLAKYPKSRKKFKRTAIREHVGCRNCIKVLDQGKPIGLPALIVRGSIPFVERMRAMQTSPETIEIVRTHGQAMADRVLLDASRAVHADDIAVDIFASAIKDERARMRRDGADRWDTLPMSELKTMLRNVLWRKKPAPRDTTMAGVLVMMMFHREFKERKRTRG